MCRCQHQPASTTRIRNVRLQANSKTTPSSRAILSRTPECKGHKSDCLSLFALSLVLLLQPRNSSSVTASQQAPPETPPEPPKLPQHMWELSRKDAGPRNTGRLRAVPVFGLQNCNKALGYAIDARGHSHDIHVNIYAHRWQFAHVINMYILYMHVCVCMCIYAINTGLAQNERATAATLFQGLGFIVCMAPKVLICDVWQLLHETGGGRCGAC